MTGVKKIKGEFSFSSDYFAARHALCDDFLSQLERVSFADLKASDEYETYILDNLIKTFSRRIFGRRNARGCADHFFNRLVNVMMSRSANTGKKFRALK